MRLLLLLSALLSALTGVGGGARGVQAHQVVTLGAARIAAPRTVRIADRRPVQALPTPVDAATPIAAPRTTVVPVQPLYASRRRE